MSKVVAISDPLDGPVRTGTEVADGVDGAVGAAARLRAITSLAQAIAATRGFADVLRVTAAEACAALDATSVSISTWERDTGRIRVLVNHGELGRGDEAIATDETYTMGDFPELLCGGERALRRVHRVDDPATDPQLAHLLRQRGRVCCLIVPIVLDGRSWGDLYASRGPERPPFDTADLEFAAVVAAQIAAGLAQAGHYERIERLAHSDPLTGLLNRRAIDHRLDQAIDRHRRYGTVVSLVVCDVNGLKRLNDERGHDVGDRLLTDFAELLGRCSASLPGSLAARLGGDEFCILAEGHPADDVVRLAEDLCRQALHLPIGDGVACGVASTGDPVGQVGAANRLFRLADAAQYRAKRSRSAMPVVAGRGQPADAVLSLAHDRLRPLSPDGERRWFRGRTADDPGHLLAAGLAGLDAAPGADALARLELVADTTARLVDAAGWWVSLAAHGSQVLRTVRFSVYRMTGEPSPERDGHDAPDAEFPLARYPLTAAAVRGGGFVVELGAPDADPAEEAILAAGGYRGVLAAGGRGVAGGWLVEVFTDEISGPVRGLVPPLRALVAVALTGAR